MDKKWLFSLSFLLGSLGIQAQDSTDVVWLEEEIGRKENLITTHKFQKDSLYQLAVDTSEFQAKKRFLKESNKYGNLAVQELKELQLLQELLLIEEKKQTKVLKSLQDE